ncbi:Twin-arginine translocation signal domain-containing protein [Helcobacillus massiliensis]|uniref:Uncharacterized protein n=1 Tax=Helcobacillus massiliensis TaxID=521392 RepID=A0A839QND8_9MICO|nr:hypothetical protein [Helcobacillus massiliensis]
MRSRGLTRRGALTAFAAAASASAVARQFLTPEKART